MTLTREHAVLSEGVDNVDTLSQKCKHFFEPCSLVHALTTSVGSPPVKQVGPTLKTCHWQVF